MEDGTFNQMLPEDPNVYVNIGQKLRALRKANGLTQAQAARLISLSPQQYQKYEDAQTKCSLNNLLILADFYGVSIDSIILQSQQVSPVEEVASNEADYLARLVSAFVTLRTPDEKIRLVQLVEAMGRGD